jgi:hypothetical protein
VRTNEDAVIEIPDDVIIVMRVTTASASGLHIVEIRLQKKKNSDRIDRRASHYSLCFCL